MPKITFIKTMAEFTVPEGVTLMHALLKQSIPVASSCLGESVCSRCRIKILEGSDNLSFETQLEKELRVRNQISDGYRISCQAQVFGNITIDTDYW